jgi:hypothetical protein
MIWFAVHAGSGDGLVDGLGCAVGCAVGDGSGAGVGVVVGDNDGVVVGDGTAPHGSVAPVAPHPPAHLYHWLSVPNAYTVRLQ